MSLRAKRLPEWKRSADATPDSFSRFIRIACSGPESVIHTNASPTSPHEVSPAEFPSVVYAELRELARRFLGGERPGHTLQPTALVHEAFLRLSGRAGLAGLSRGEFLNAAAAAMRRILVDHARKRRALKRGGANQRVALDDTVARYEERAVDLVGLDKALNCLGRLDPQLLRIVELRFFIGLSEEEAGSALGISGRSVRRAWRVARMWLSRELGRADDGSA